MILVNCLSHAKIHGMDSENQISKNHVSHVHHQKQRFWQILFPVIIFSLVIIGVCVLMIMSVTGVKTGIDLSQTADTALIWMIVPLLGAAMLFAVILFFLIYGIARIIKVLPDYTFRIQEFFWALTDQVQVMADKLAAPAIGIRRFFAGAKTLFATIFRR